VCHPHAAHPRTLSSPPIRRVHLRRGDRADREPRGPPGQAQAQTSLPGQHRAVRLPHHRHQRRDGRRVPHHLPERCGPLYHMVSLLVFRVASVGCVLHTVLGGSCRAVDHAPPVREGQPLKSLTTTHSNFPLPRAHRRQLVCRHGAAQQHRHEAVRHLGPREQPHRGGGGDVHHPARAAGKALRR
jgi:hypothetical protein